MDKLDNSNVSKHLGKSSQYTCFYDPELLVREPRQSNRSHLSINDDELPFVGYDTWNGYEVTGLTESGLPVFCIVKVMYRCDNPYIVESKSMKLYFNSFSMTRMGDTNEEVINNIVATSKKDLSNLLETDVEVCAFTTKCLDVIDNEIYCETSEDTYSFVGDRVHVFATLDKVLTDVSIDYKDDFNITDYNENPDIIEVSEYDYDIGCGFHSALLRSRCRVTSQPDSGDVYIYVKGKKQPTAKSLLKYIVSFRDECHFHEEICETIYKRLYDILEPEELVVRCLYARRGGWDINPERASSEKLLHPNLKDVTKLHKKTMRQ